MRGFAAVASGLLLPTETERVRVYSFVRVARRAPSVRFYEANLCAELPRFERAAGCLFELTLDDRHSLGYSGRSFVLEAVTLGGPGSFALLHDCFGKTVCPIAIPSHPYALRIGDSLSVDLAHDQLSGFAMNAALDAAAAS